MTFPDVPFTDQIDWYQVQFEDVDVIEFSVEFHEPMKVGPARVEGAVNRASATWTKPARS